MHILILPMYYPEPEAPAHRGYMFYEQAMQIAESGHKVGLAYTEQRQLKKLSLKRISKESHFQITEENNGSFVTLRMHAWNPKLSTYVGGIIWSRLTLLLVQNYIKRYGKPDIIHAHFGLWAGYAAYLVNKRYGIPYVITEHASSINKQKVTPRQGKILRVTYKNSKKVICVGSLLRRRVYQFTEHPNKSVVIPNFVDISTFLPCNHQTDKEKKFTFVSVGNLSWRKGFEDLIEAFNLSFSNRPHVSLVIAGDGKDAVKLRKKIKELHLEAQVTLAGRLSREEVAQLLSSSDAFVLASYAETFGIVFIEAMATGMPAIGTDCGGPEDIITPESGYLVDPGEVDMLANEMIRLYDNYEQFDKERIRQSIIERFDFRLAGPQLIEIYEQ